MVTFTINIPPMLVYIYYIYTIHGSYGLYDYILIISLCLPSKIPLRPHHQVQTHYTLIMSLVYPYYIHDHVQKKYRLSIINMCKEKWLMQDSSILFIHMFHSSYSHYISTIPLLLLKSQCIDFIMKYLPLVLIFPIQIIKAKIIQDSSFTSSSYFIIL